jgi:hypothetical protein
MKQFLPFLTFIFYLFISFEPVSDAQNAPVTTVATAIGSSGTVMVPVTVTGFSNIGSVYLSIDYNYSVLHFVSGTPNPLLPSFPIGDQDLATGYHRITMGWFGSGVSLTDGSTIMTLNFSYISGNTTLAFQDNGPSCEYTNSGGTVLNDIPASAYYINGWVCGIVASPGTITGDNSVCRGEQGLIYSVVPVTNAAGYTWSVPSGSSITHGQNTNSVRVDYSTAAISGNISVHGVNACGNGPSSQLPVTVNLLPVADAGNDATIPYNTSTTLHAASGGAGSFSYHWTPATLLVNPDLQNPQTVNMVLTTLFQVVVTNLSTQCRDSDQVIVTISGGPLSVNPAALPGTVCRGGTAQLFANAGGGSGNYTWSWTCTPPGSPPWTSNSANPLVTPDSSETYHVSVSDGSGTISGSVPVTVRQLSTATLTGGDTLCGDADATTLTVDLAGTPPWTFMYSDGLSTSTVYDQTTTPYHIVTSTAGTYAVLYLADGNCDGMTYGQAIVAKFPVPATPGISEAGVQLSSTSCCGNQWYKDQVLIPGATGQYYTPVVTAHYCDVVTINGCVSDTSNDIYFLMTGIGRLHSGLFSIEPNPARDFVVVSSKTGMTDILKIQVLTIEGKVVKTFPVDAITKNDRVLINIQYLSPGMYFLVISTESEKVVCKLVVQS